MRQNLLGLTTAFRFLNGDYALKAALQNYSELHQIVISYDVACQYCKHFFERIRKVCPDLTGLQEKLVFLVPKMHLMAHKTDCQYLHSFNFTEGVGRTDGEQVERNWAKVNANAGSTKEMTGGHRHDTLNDHHQNFNFDKMRSIGQYIILSLTFTY